MNAPDIKNVLLIEDEIHKREELTTYLFEFVGSKMILNTVDSVREAVMAVSKDSFDLIVLDMALPTFTTSDGVIDGGLDQALGGVEVLRTLRSLRKSANIIIVTQYPDISVGGKRIKLKAAQSVLAAKYQQNIRGAVLYKYKSALNRAKIKTIMESIW